MWLKKLVAACMIAVFVAMNVIVVLGALEKVPANDSGDKSSDSADNTVVVSPPVVKLEVLPGTIKAGSYAAISWLVTGNSKSCDASGDWTGSKTVVGRESTGRITTSGVYTYTLKCTGDGGQSEASASLIVE